MAESSIAVDLFNPGQVFACLGFLEAAELLCGAAEGGFDWSDETDVRFLLRAAGECNPIGVVLEFLSVAAIEEQEPTQWPGHHDDSAVITDTFPSSMDRHKTDGGKWSRTAFPIDLAHGASRISVSHWSDGSSRADFKLYSGNRTGGGIAQAMLHGVRKKPTRRMPEGELVKRGVTSLWRARRKELLASPFEVLTDMGGSFNLDPRGGWTALDAGYSPNEHDHHGVAASPVVEILAAIGLEHARPEEYETRKIRYGVWGAMLPPMLARTALGGVRVGGDHRVFRFELTMAGKNKVVTFAQEETHP